MYERALDVHFFIQNSFCLSVGHLSTLWWRNRQMAYVTVTLLCEKTGETAFTDPQVGADAQELQVFSSLWELLLIHSLHRGSAKKCRTGWQSCFSGVCSRTPIIIGIFVAYSTKDRVYYCNMWSKFLALYRMHVCSWPCRARPNKSLSCSTHYQPHHPSPTTPIFYHALYILLSKIKWTINCVM